MYILIKLNSKKNLTYLLLKIIFVLDHDFCRLKSKVMIIFKNKIKYLYTFCGCSISRAPHESASMLFFFFFGFFVWVPHIIRSSTTPSYKKTRKIAKKANNHPKIANC